MENFHRQVPVITTLVTTELENEEVTQIITGTTLLEIEQCADDCDVDYKVDDETREEVLDELATDPR